MLGIDLFQLAMLAKSRLKSTFDYEHDIELFETLSLGDRLHKVSQSILLPLG